jgi:flagellar protein FliT
MPETLYDYYQAIETASRQMLEAAQTENWDQVVRYEGACAVLIEQLRHKARSTELSVEERKDKARIMQRILRNDAEVRLLAEPWLSELDQLLSPQTAQRLH